MIYSDFDIAVTEFHVAKLEKRIAELEAANNEVNAQCMKEAARADELEAERDRLREALELIDGQTNDCEADETYYGGVWREVNLTAKTALEEIDNE